MVSKLPRELKSIFRIICLANLLKNFRWLKFDFSKLKQFINCPRCFLFVFALFNLQGTERPNRLSGELFQFSINTALCQELFSFSCHFFSVFFANFLRPLPKALAYNNKHFLSCQVLFSPFFNYFFLSFYWLLLSLFGGISAGLCGSPGTGQRLPHSPPRPTYTQRSRDADVAQFLQ